MPFSWRVLAGMGAPTGENQQAKTQAVGVCRLLACPSRTLNVGPPPRREPDAVVTAVSWLAGLVARLLPAATEDGSSIELVYQAA